ncbi:hypothetical protein ACFE04_005709 [Oxalis oulophora]
MALRRHFLLVAIILTLIITNSVTKSDKVHVRIVNFLELKTESGLELFVQCISKDHDLGEHTIGYNSELENPGDGPISCIFAWDADHRIFDIYRQERDGTCPECIWGITREKPCRLFSRGEREETCYSW